MILYKFKPVEQLGFLLDILSNEQIYAAHYGDLNDPFEGQLISVRKYIPELMYPFVGGDPRGKTRTRRIREVAEGLVGEATVKRVCSLSATCSDVRMWSLYASGHQGVAFELDFEGFDNLHEVRYSESLIEGGRTLLGPTATDVLTRKTSHWAYEREYRLLTDQEFVSVEGRIKRVLLGHRASRDIEKLLNKLVPPGASVVRTELDHEHVRVTV